MDGDDVRVIEGGGGTGFPGEALDDGWIVRVAIGQNLQRDIAVEPQVVGAVDFAHATRSEERCDPVGSQVRSDRESACDAIVAVHGRDARLQKMFGVRRNRQQSVDFAAKSSVAATCIVEERRPLAGGQPDTGVEQLFDPPPALTA